MLASHKKVWDRCTRDIERDVVKVTELGESSARPMAMGHGGYAVELHAINPSPPESFADLHGIVSQMLDGPMPEWPTLPGSLDLTVGAKLPPMGPGDTLSIEITNTLPPSDPASLKKFLDALAKKNAADKKRKKKQ